MFDCVSLLCSSYECDCDGTGFEGDHCEDNIQECASDPCQHGSTCLDGINQYECVCWPGTLQLSTRTVNQMMSITEEKSGVYETSPALPSMWTGYEGENCQVDINECEQNPCDNSGTCFQRSDVQNYRKLPELSTTTFSYDIAAGFICLCMPGFTGELHLQKQTNKKRNRFLNQFFLKNALCFQATTALSMWMNVGLLRVSMGEAVRIWSTLIDVCVQTASQVRERPLLLFLSRL